MNLWVNNYSNNTARVHFKQYMIEIHLKGIQIIFNNLHLVLKALKIF